MPVAAPHHADAAAKTQTPNRNIRRRPNVSPSEPPTRISEPSNSKYASTTHCKSVTVAPKLVCKAGSATFTTVLSMNAMLEPSIVATRIHGFEPAAANPVTEPVEFAMASDGDFIQIGGQTKTTSTEEAVGSIAVSWMKIDKKGSSREKSRVRAVQKRRPAARLACGGEKPVGEGEEGRRTLSSGAV